MLTDKTSKFYNEKGAVMVEYIIVIIFVVLMAGALVLILYNSVVDRSDKTSSGVRATANDTVFDIDNDGAVNQLILVGIHTNGTTRYWRPADLAQDYGILASVTPDTNDDNDLLPNAGEASAYPTGAADDDYFTGIGALSKSVNYDPHNAKRP